MSIDNKFNDIKAKIMNMKHIDREKFVDELHKWITEISFFYNVVAKNEQNPSHVSYKIKPSKRPTEGHIAYFNLRRGYPKETYDDHWCYILKDFGTKYLIIPTTSIKEDLKKCNENYEMDIDDYTNNGKSRLQITDLRSVDAMRVSQSVNPNYYDVKTPRSTIIEKVEAVIFS